MTDYETPLQTAVFKADIKEVKSLLRSGVNIEEEDIDRRTAIQHATIDGSADLVAYLIQEGANLDHQDSIGYTALHYAAQNGIEKITSLLIKGGAAIDLKDQHGNTPLWKAVFSYKDDQSIIETLVMAGADPYLKNHHSVSAADLADTKGDNISLGRNS